MEKLCKSAKDVLEYYKNQGVKDTRLDSLNVEINRVPESGVFGNPTVGTIKTADGETVFPAIEVFADADMTERIGYVAIGTLEAGEAIPTKVKENGEVETVETQQIKRPSSKYKNLYMVKSRQINNLAKFGNSQAQRVANLFGKSFSTRPHKTVVARVTADGSQFKPKAAEAAKQFDPKTIYFFDITG